MTTKIMLRLVMACAVALAVIFGWSGTAHAQCAPIAGPGCNTHCVKNCQGAGPLAGCQAGCGAAPVNTGTVQPETPPTDTTKWCAKLNKKVPANQWTRAKCYVGGTKMKTCCDGSKVEEGVACPGMKLCPDGSEIWANEPCPGEIQCTAEVEGQSLSFIFPGEECPDLTAGADEDEEDDEEKCEDPCFNEINESIADINGGTPWWVWILVVLLVIIDIVLTILFRNKKDEDEGGTPSPEGEPQPETPQQPQPAPQQQPAAQPAKKRKAQSLD